MRCSVNVELRSYRSNEGVETSDILGSKVSINFVVQRHHVLVTTTDGGSETIIGQRSVPYTEQVISNIEFHYLLIPQVNQNYIHDMLMQIEIPPSTIEELKRRISTYAAETAVICIERRSRFSGIVVEFDVQVVEYYGEEDNEEFETMLMDIDGDGGFSLVPTSRSSIEALEIKKFDYTQGSSSSIETCMICMDEFVRGVDITSLPCSHSFHNECIVKWLENKNSCPLCRFAMPKEED